MSRLHDPYCSMHAGTLNPESNVKPYIPKAPHEPHFMVQGGEEYTVEGSGLRGTLNPKP